MAETRSAQQIRSEIAHEREELVRAVVDLRREVAGALDVGAKLATRLPAVAAGAAGAGFFLAGGVGATMRYLARRGRERKVEHALETRVGRYAIVRRD